MPDAFFDRSSQTMLVVDWSITTTGTCCLPAPPSWPFLVDASGLAAFVIAANV
jgi:hypothetical protein